jgi:hypothetical protein
MLQTTKFGEAQYPYLTQPDYMFSPDGKYHVKLKLTKEDAKEDIQIVNEIIAKQIADNSKQNSSKEIKRAPLPYEMTDDGFVIFNFKMKASGINSKTKAPFTQKPKIVDHETNPLPEDKNIWGGSIIRVSYEPIGYNIASTGVGCSLRLKAVQVKKLVEGSLNHGFSKVEPEVTTIF